MSSSSSFLVIDTSNTLFISCVVVIATIVLLLVVRQFKARKAVRPIVFVGSSADEQTFDPSRPIATPSKGQVLVPIASRLRLLLPMMLRQEHICERFYRFHREHGNIVNIDFAGIPSFNIADANGAKKLFVSSVDVFEKDDARLLSSNKFAFDFLGNRNVLFSNGHQWTKQRKVINPLFFDVSRFIPLFRKEFEICFNVIDAAYDAKQGGSLVDPASLMHRMTLDVLGETVLHHPFNALTSKKSKELDAYNLLMNNLINPLAILIPKYEKLPLPKVKALDSALSTMNSLVSDLLGQAKSKAARLEESHKHDDEASVVDNMVQSGELDDKEIRDNAIILFLAGHETSANALSFAMLSLGMYPEIQQQLLEELRRDVGEDLGNMDKISACTYLDYFLKETLRMYPPVSRTPPRRVIKDVEVNGYLVPKDAMAFVDIYSIHHNEHYWPNSFVFDPLRFSPENSKHRPQHAWAPFGAGKRICLGMLFAMQEMKAYLAAFVQRYRVETVSGFEKPILSNSNTIMELKAGFQIKIVKRN